MPNNSEKYTFPRGVHPPEGKDLSENCAIEALPTPDRLFLSVQQNIGAPCVCSVNPRETVLADACLANSDAFVSAPVHAPLPGVVSRPTKKTLPNGRRTLTVVLDVDKETAQSEQAILDVCLGGDWTIPDNLDPKTFDASIHTGGIVGMGGAAFPTHVKLAPNDKKPIDTVLINGSECEPYLTADYRVMLEYPQPVIVGGLLVAMACRAKSVFFCIEDNKPEAIESMRAALAKVSIPAGLDAQVRTMKTKYPQGGEKQLILAALGRKVPFPGLPMDVGVDVQNVATATAIAARILRNKNLTHRVVTVTGRGIKQPKNLFVPMGTPIQALIDYCDGLTEDAQRVILGGPMMGFAVGSLDIPVTKGTSGITVLTRQELVKSVETNCVHCGRCVSVCPMNLVPTKLALAARAKNLEVLQAYNVGACMECGSCAYVCPASLPLVQLIRTGKGLIQQEKAKAKN